MFPNCFTLFKRSEKEGFPSCFQRKHDHFKSSKSTRGSLFLIAVKHFFCRDSMENPGCPFSMGIIQLPFVVEYANIFEINGTEKGSPCVDAKLVFSRRIVFEHPGTLIFWAMLSNMQAYSIQHWAKYTLGNSFFSEDFFSNCFLTFFFTGIKNSFVYFFEINGTEKKGLPSCV